jgi:hypothetical protein
LREYEPAFREKNANLAAIGLGGRKYAWMFREETKITFPLLIDEKRLAYRAAGLGTGNILHIFRADNSAARSRARAAGHKQRKTGKNPFQLGGSFVFAPGNIDLFAHISQTFGDNANPETLVAAIK